MTIVLSVFHDTPDKIVKVVRQSKTTGHNEHVIDLPANKAIQVALWKDVTLVLTEKDRSK